MEAGRNPLAGTTAVDARFNRTASQKTTRRRSAMNRRPARDAAAGGRSPDSGVQITRTVSVCIFSHPDCTVGFGLTPNQPRP